MITFDNRGVAASSGRTPNTIAQMALDAIDFIDSLGVGSVDLLGFSIGSFLAQEMLSSARPACAGWCWPPRRPGERAKCTAGLLM